MGTSHRLLMVIWLAQTILSCAKLRPLRVIRKVNFCWHWTGCGDARRLCFSESMFQAFALVWQTAQNGRLHKTGEPTIRAACTPQTVLDRLFWCLFCFFYSYLAIFPAVLLNPQQSAPNLRYTRKHLPSAVPWISEDRLFVTACHQFVFKVRGPSSRYVNDTVTPAHSRFSCLLFSSCVDYVSKYSRIFCSL